MKYYKIDPDLFGAEWAYGEVYSQCIRYDPSVRPVTCPLCGRDIEGSRWVGEYNVMVSRKKLGDVIYGVPDLLLVSERFVALCKQNHIRGITQFTEVSLFYRGKKLDTRYFQATIGYSMKKLAFAKEQNRKRMSDKSLPKCSLCMKSGNGAKDDWKQRYCTGEPDADIFKIYEKKGRFFCDQVFVDFCKENKITNIIDYFREIVV